MNWFKKHILELGVVVIILNFLAAILLLFPLLDTTKNVDDDFILQLNRQTGEYTQKKHLVDRKIGILAFILLIPGFSFQIFEVLANRSHVR